MKSLTVRDINDTTLAISEIHQKASDTSYIYKPFDDELIKYTSYLSESLLSHPESELFPELISLGFWLRKSSINEMQNHFQKLSYDKLTRVPLGLALHIPPSNVETIFIYSLVISLLSGNKNIVRLSQRRGAQSKILIEIILRSLIAFPKLTDHGYIQLISFEHNTDVFKEISSELSLRIIWGGDETVSTLSRVPLPLNAREILFPDKYSYSVINAESLLGLDEEAFSKLILSFHNDVYWFKQRACSSPKVVFWIGNSSKSEEVQSKFLETLEAINTKKGRDLEAAVRIDKFTKSCIAASLNQSCKILSDTPYLTVIQTDLNSHIRTIQSADGYLYFININSIDDLKIFVDKNDQTVTYFGLSDIELKSLIQLSFGSGIDRIVHIGNALSFSHIWDGMDLFSEMTKVIGVS